jgi:hypothetical protein
MIIVHIDEQNTLVCYIVGVRFLLLVGIRRVNLITVYIDSFLILQTHCSY